MELKKTPKANLEDKKGTFFLIGLDDTLHFESRKK